MKRTHFGFLICALIAFAGVGLGGCTWDVTPSEADGSDVVVDETLEVPSETLEETPEVTPPEVPAPPAAAVEDCGNGTDADGDIDCKDSDCDDDPTCLSHTVNPHQNFAPPARKATMIDLQDL